MKDITGPNNPNYRHGKYASWTEDTIYFHQALARATLKSILTAQFDDDGHIKGHTPEEVRWAMGIVREKPEWAMQVFKDLGFFNGDDGS